MNKEKMLLLSFKKFLQKLIEILRIKTTMCKTNQALCITKSKSLQASIPYKWHTSKVEPFELSQVDPASKKLSSVNNQLT